VDDSAPKTFRFPSLADAPPQLQTVAGSAPSLSSHNWPRAGCAKAPWPWPRCLWPTGVQPHRQACGADSAGRDPETAASATSAIATIPASVACCPWRFPSNGPRVWSAPNTHPALQPACAVRAGAPTRRACSRWPGCPGSGRCGWAYANARAAVRSVASRPAAPAQLRATGALTLLASVLYLEDWAGDGPQGEKSRPMPCWIHLQLRKLVVPSQPRSPPVHPCGGRQPATTQACIEWISAISPLGLDGSKAQPRPTPEAARPRLLSATICSLSRRPYIGSDRVAGQGTTSTRLAGGASREHFISVGRSRTSTWLYRSKSPANQPKATAIWPRRKHHSCRSVRANYGKLPRWRGHFKLCTRRRRRSACVAGDHRPQSASAPFDVASMPRPAWSRHRSWERGHPRSGRSTRAWMRVSGWPSRSCPAFGPQLWEAKRLRLRHRWRSPSPPTQLCIGVQRISRHCPIRSGAGRLVREGPVALAP